MKTILPVGLLLLLAMAVPAQAQDFTSVVCNNQGEGWAECEAVCPAGQVVLHCSYNMGNTGSGDSCGAISRFHFGPVSSNGQAMPQPHDRCHMAVQCQESGQSLSVQLFATCFAQ